MHPIVFYNVVVNDITTTSPGDGFIDPKLANNYLSVDSTTGQLTGWPSSNDNALAKARGNVRWNIVKEQLGLTLNVLSVNNVVVTGGDINTDPTSVSFDVVYDRPSALFTNDEYNTGVVLSGADAVKRFVARALLLSRSINYTVLNSVENIPDPISKSYETVSLEVGPVASDISSVNAVITVTEVVAS